MRSVRISRIVLGLLASAILLVSAVGCNTFNPQAPGCSSDRDCTPGYTCTNGACNLKPDSGSPPDGDAGETGDGDAGGNGDGDVGTTDSDNGPGNISGTAHGAPFTTVATALYIGAPDNPATLVVDLFSQPVDCSTISSTGWDSRISSGTQVLEMKLAGKTPGNYTVTTNLTLKPGEASINATLATHELQANSGTITLTAIQEGVFARGTFSVHVDDALVGTFNATYCPGGVEP